jgi:hypothetical protein
MDVVSEVTQEMRRRLHLAREAEGANRAAQLEDNRFRFGEQWPAAMKIARQIDKRPALTINKTDTFVRSVVNNMRAQRPRIRVHPVADGADMKKADVIEGLIRHIEVNSNADLAYDTAGDFQVSIGEGYWRICSRYVAEDSFDQELYIDRIRNPFTVYMDPSAAMPDGSDAEWCILTSSMKKSAFRKKYPHAKVADVNDLGPGDDKAVWASAEEVIIAEYYRFEEREDELWLLSNGQKVLKSRAPMNEHELLVTYNIRIVHRRKTTSRQLKWSLCSAVEELEERDLPGKYIPVVRVIGAEMIDAGKIIRFGMVRQLKDPQRMYNYWRTQETEFVALAPLAPWLIAEGQDEGHEDEWQNANRKSYSRLTYKPVHDEQGNLLPPPQRLTPQQIPAASVNAAMSASEDLKAVAGMFDPALGAPGQETSGRMVTARQGQSDMSNFHFYDNLTRSICYTGVILLDLIPYYYDTQRVIRILGIDGVPQTTTINEKVRDELGAIREVLNDITVGTYDVVMDTGPGYQTKRQENSEMLLGLLKTMPQVAQAAGDLVVRQMDFEAAQDVADRLAAANPLAMAEKELPKDLPDDVKAFIAHLMGTVQQQQQALQQAELEKKYRMGVEQLRQQGKLASDQLWAEHEMRHEHVRQDGENRRLLAKEHAQNLREEVKSRTKLEDTQMRNDESWREAQLDAATDLKLSQDRGPNNEFHREHA